MTPPIVFKPVDASGSRGITRLDRLEPGSVERAFRKAQSYSPSKVVCVEEFVPGTEVGGDAVLIRGQVAFIAITHKRMQGFVVTGHSLPTNVTARDQQRVIEHLTAVCAALGYRHGPLNFDVIVSPDAVTTLEMSARNGGNGIAGVIERATGVDVEQATIRMALGVVPDLPVRTHVARCAGSYVFGHPTGGRLHRICELADLQRRVPQVFHAVFAKQPGDRIEPFEHNGNLIGFALFDCLSPDEYERVTERIGASLDIAVSPQ
jgi:biotin carboxylase